MDGALGFTPAIGTDDDLSLARVPIGQRFQNPQGHPAGRHFIHLRALKNSQGALPTLPPPSRLSDPISPEGSDTPRQSPNHLHPIIRDLITRNPPASCAHVRAHAMPPSQRDFIPLNRRWVGTLRDSEEWSNRAREDSYLRAVGTRDRRSLNNSSNNSSNNSQPLCPIHTQHLSKTS